MPWLAHVLGVQHLLFPLQTWPNGQLPQFRLVFVQVSVTTPQASAEQVAGVHGTHLPVLQTSPFAQLPHWILPPQPSPQSPHSRPRSAHVFGVHDEQTLSEQVAPAAHEPHSSFAPVHGLVRTPQVFPIHWQ
jgi:hypothetical protein